MPYPYYRDTLLRGGWGRCLRVAAKNCMCATPPAPTPAVSPHRGKPRTKPNARRFREATKCCVFTIFPKRCALFHKTMRLDLGNLRHAVVKTHCFVNKNVSTLFDINATFRKIKHNGREWNKKQRFNFIWYKRNVSKNKTLPPLCFLTVVFYFSKLSHRSKKKISAPAHLL